MNNKQKKQARVAMAVALAVTSVAHSTGSIFAQSESTIEELNIVDTVENKTEIEDLESPVEETEDLESIVENPLENIENTELVEKTVGDVEINVSNFPDGAFRQYIRTNFDIDKDGILSSDEINRVTRIEVIYTDITSLEGIEYFPNLEYLNCELNYILTKLDVSKNTALTYLNCYNTRGITELDVSKNTALTYLRCHTIGITELDVSKNTALTYLECQNTGITELDISQNTALTSLNVAFNEALINLDISQNTALTSLKCQNTGITELDISQNTALTSLNCYSTGITELDVSQNTALISLSCWDTGITELDVSKNTALTSLECYRTGITELDVSKNTALTSLECYRTGITELDVSKNTALEYLNCYNTRITELDVSKNTALRDLRCYSTGITELDVSQNTALISLSCWDTGITELDVSKNTALIELNCSGTRITNLDVSKNTALRRLSADNNNLAWLNIGDNPNLSSLSISNSKFELGKVEDTFNIADLFPGIDLDKITVTSGASLDKTTGIVSRYTNGTPITYTYDCGTRDNGNAVTLDVTLNFSKKNPSSIIINDNLNKVYDGQAVANPTDIEVTGSTGAVSIEWYTADDKKLDEAPVNVGSYKVKVILAEDINYKGIEVEKAFEITKANNQWIQELSIENWVYGEAVNTPSAEVQFGIAEFTYSTTENGIYTADVPSSAGTYWVKATVTGTNNYDGLETKKSFTIEKASSVITIDNDLNKVYDGQAVSEPKVTVTGSTGTVSIEWYQKEETTTKAITWKKLATAPSAVGEYKVVVTVGEDGNYIETTKEQEFSILENKVVVPTPGTGEETTTTPAQGVTGVQTGDSTQAGLWAILAGLSTGLMMYFRKKNRKEEV